MDSLFQVEWRNVVPLLINQETLLVMLVFLVALNVALGIVIVMSSKILDNLTRAKERYEHVVTEQDDEGDLNKVPVAIDNVSNDNLQPIQPPPPKIPFPFAQPNPYPWQIVGESVRGTGHIKHELPCQDYHAYRHLENGMSIIAVADGAGSALRADKGAEFAVTSSIQYLEEHLEMAHERYVLERGAEMIRNAFHAARHELHHMAECNDVSVNDFATTLILVILTPNYVIAAMVGDGMGIAELSDGRFKPMFRLPQREYANQMVSITSPQAFDELQIQCYCEPIRSVTLMTDGLINLSCEKRVVDGSRELLPKSSFFQAFTDLFYRVPSHEMRRQYIHATLDGDLINDRTTDDKTLVVAKQCGDYDDERYFREDNNRGSDYDHQEFEGDETGALLQQEPAAD